MEFLTALHEQDFGQMDRVHNGLRYRQFSGIMFGDSLWLSIQASCAHYSKPRETLDDLSQYTHWEIAIFNIDEFVQVKDVLPSFSSLIEIELYHEGSVYPFVPADLVNELYLALIQEKKRDDLH